MRVEELFDLTDRVALVTGGATGLGKQMAAGLAEMGADIAVASRNQDRCDLVAAEFRAMGRRALGVSFNLANVESIQSMVKCVVTEFGHIDILVNCAAAVGLTSPYEPITPGIWDDMIGINVNGTFWCSQEVAKVMKKQRSGKIINIASVYATVGVDPHLYGRTGEDHFEHFPLSASKGAVISLTRDMAVNLAR